MFKYYYIINITYIIMTTKFNEYNDKGLTGLANLGNTCYLNSCLQTLSHTYELNNLLKNLNFDNLKEYSKNLDGLNILIEWKNLLDLMWSKNCTIAPHGFVKAIHAYSVKKNNSLFCNFSQNDLQEFLMFLFDAFHLGISKQNEIYELYINNMNNNKITDINTHTYNEFNYFKMMNDNFKNEYSELVDLFYGACYSEITCIETNKVLAKRFQPFFILNLSIPEKNNISLYDCFEYHLKYEELKDDNAWLNEKTNSKVNVKKRDVLWKLPDIFIIHLKRWNYKGQKNQSIIQFDLNCDFSKYICNSNCNNNNNNNNYELYSISNHHGNSMGGHYTAFVKNANNKWYHFNDTNVAEVNQQNLVTNQAYCLFYRKQY